MRSKKLLSLMLAAILSLNMAVATAFAADETAPNNQTSPKPAEETIVLLHTNDVHGAIERYAQVAALKDKYEKEGAYVLLVDAGDFIQGDPTVNTTQGASAVELMNMSEYDAAALGNHEFDFGYENIKKLEAAADFPMLGANILYNGNPAVGDRMVFTSPAGTKIGIFGVDTPETATKAHPGKIKGVTFLGQTDAKDMFKNAQEQVDKLKAEGCALVICLGHLGTDMESVGHRSIDLLENVKGIDVLIDGHSHSTLEEVKEATGGSGKVNDTYLTSTGTKLESVGKVTITDGKVSEVAALPTKDLDVTPDPAVAARAKEIRQGIDDAYGTVFAKTEVDLDGAKSNVRTKETNMGNLITDAMVWGAAQNDVQVDAAVTNGGGIRAAIAKGDITKKDVNTVLPFGNELSIVKLTGAQLLEALEASTFCTPESIGGFPHVSGIEFTLNTAKKYDAGENYPGSTYAGPNSINRVSIQTVGGKPFDPAATYTIVTNDFIAQGGDTYYVFKQAASNINLGIPLDEVLIDYIGTELKGAVTAEAYGSTDGRITMVDNPAVPEKPVVPEKPEKPAVKPVKPVAPAQQTFYVVKAGDSLWKIAKANYGSGTQWKMIYEANKATIKNPTRIYIGQKLVLPAA